MKTRKLGNDGLTVSAIGFGAMSITGFLDLQMIKHLKNASPVHTIMELIFSIQQMSMDLDYQKN